MKSIKQIQQKKFQRNISNKACDDNNIFKHRHVHAK